MNDLGPLLQVGELRTRNPSSKVLRQCVKDYGVKLADNIYGQVSAGQFRIHCFSTERTIKAVSDLEALPKYLYHAY